MPSPTLDREAVVRDKVYGLSVDEVWQKLSAIQGIPYVPSFPVWLREHDPNWTWDRPFQHIIQAQLQRVTDGACRRIILSVPPRHGKSESVTVRYSAYRMHRNPMTRIAITAHTQDLAELFSRKIRNVIQPKLGLSDTRFGAAHWETKEGGYVKAVGVGGAIAGYGFDLLIVDDPVRNREDVESLTAREKVWNWFTDDLYTRQEGLAAIIVVSTRWHEDDLAGRLLNPEINSNWASWTVLNFPALAEDDDVLGREVGEALWEARENCSKEFLEDVRRTQSAYAFNALYQGHPIAHEGNLFKVDNIKLVGREPVDCIYGRGWDKASTAGGGDYTAGPKLAYSPSMQHWYVVDVVRGRWNTHDRDMRILQTAHADTRACRVWGEREPGPGGEEAARAFIRMLMGFNVHVDPSSSSKVSRAGGVNAADGFSSQVNAGNVSVVKGAWNKAFLYELQGFPEGVHDDQVDGVCGIFNHMAKFVGYKRMGWIGKSGGMV